MSAFRQRAAKRSGGATFAHVLSDFLRTESKGRPGRRPFSGIFECRPVAQIAGHFGFSESKVKSMLMRTRSPAGTVSRSGGVGSDE